MLKRKREDEGSPEVADPKQKRLQLKLEQGTVKVGHAFKVAKGFERQKLGRRQKTAASEKNEKNADRIEAEIAALKALDTTVAGRHHLYKCLLKIKAVAGSPRLEPELTKLQPIQRDAATLNILSRLSSSKPAKEALNAAMEDIQRAAGVTRKAPKRSESPPSKDKKAAPPVEDPMEITDSEDDAGAGAGEDSEDEFGGFDGRLAGSDGSDDEDDSMDDRPPPTKTKASSFLPSLSVGYVAGSGSEPESDIEELAPVKKNRRGQRARQQIAEKKYGQKAKHLEKQQNDRGSGWDAKRGATESNRGKKGDMGVGRGGYGKGHAASSREPPAPPKRKHKDDEGPIHPSWAAAKAAKEKKSAPVAFAGTKISFD
ncbi:hypothetical protein Q7P37_000732 [Cladosporium fusiforme]